MKEFDVVIIGAGIHGAGVAQAAAAALEDDTRDDQITLLCANSLSSASLAAPQGVTIVANAMIHIASRQQQGWSYIRA